MTVKQYVTQALETPSDAQLHQVAKYLAFLKFHARVHAIPCFDAAQATSLYAEFAEEDRAMAQEGMEDYNAGLIAEDA